MASKNIRELSVVLACCHMATEATIDIAAKGENLKEICEDCKRLLLQIMAIRDELYADVKFTENDYKAIQQQIQGLGEDWDGNNISIASMHIFCAGILETQIDRIEKSKKLKRRCENLTLLKNKFDGLWHLINSWFPHDTAEEDSIKLFNDFNMVMG